MSVERLCPEVNDTVYARLVSSNAPFVPNTVLRYECNEGYELTNGHLELSCQKDGQWSGKAPNCTGNVDKLCCFAVKLLSFRWKKVAGLSGGEM